MKNYSLLLQPFKLQDEFIFVYFSKKYKIRLNTHFLSKHEKKYFWPIRTSFFVGNVKTWDAYEWRYIVPEWDDMKSDIIFRTKIFNWNPVLINTVNMSRFYLYKYEGKYYWLLFEQTQYTNCATVSVFILGLNNIRRKKCRLNQVGYFLLDEKAFIYEKEDDNLIPYLDQMLNKLKNV